MNTLVSTLVNTYTPPHPCTSGAAMGLPEGPKYDRWRHSPSGEAAHTAVAAAWASLADPDINGNTEVGPHRGTALPLKSALV